MRPVLLLYLALLTLEPLDIVFVGIQLPSLLLLELLEFKLESLLLGLLDSLTDARILVDQRLPLSLAAFLKFPLGMSQLTLGVPL